ncbi:TPA: hypothetical protein ACU20E_005410, partial [Escherichia coli]
IMHPGTGFPVPSLSTPEIFTAAILAPQIKIIPQNCGRRHSFTIGCFYDYFTHETFVNISSLTH